MSVRRVAQEAEGNVNDLRYALPGFAEGIVISI
jgi:hypothetical protein